jgi:hypothetical protein
MIHPLRQTRSAVKKNVVKRRVYIQNTPKSPCRRWMIGKRNGKFTQRAIKVAAGEFPVAIGCRCAIGLSRRESAMTTMNSFDFSMLKWHITALYD